MNKQKFVDYLRSPERLTEGQFDELQKINWSSDVLTQVSKISDILFTGFMSKEELLEMLSIANNYAVCSFSDMAHSNAAIAEQMRIQADGAVIVNNGITLGNGLTYAAANTLDEYEEGTFTLAMYSGQSGTITNHFAKYTKIGNTDKATNAKRQFIANITKITTNIFKISLTIINTPWVKKLAMVSISETTLVTSLPTEVVSK